VAAESFFAAKRAFLASNFFFFETPSGSGPRGLNSVSIHPETKRNHIDERQLNKTRPGGGQEEATVASRRRFKSRRARQGQ
jgi:hypothetical protein